MATIKLIINGSEIDIVNVDVSLEYLLPKATNEKTKQSLRSDVCTLPITTANRQILQNANILSIDGDNFFPCKLIYNGIDVGVKFMTVESVKRDTMSVRFYGKAGEILKTLSNKLSALQSFRKYNRHWDVTTIQECYTTPNFPLCFPLGDYVEGGTDATDTNIKVGRAIPHFDAHEVFKACFQENGYSVDVSAIINQPIYNQRKLLIPLTQNGIARTKSTEQYLGKFSCTTSTPGIYDFVEMVNFNSIISQKETYYVLYSIGGKAGNVNNTTSYVPYIGFPVPLRLRVRVTGQVLVNTADPSTNGTVRFYNGFPNGANAGQMLAEIPNNGTNTMPFDLTFDIDTLSKEWTIESSKGTNNKLSMRAYNVNNNIAFMTFDLEILSATELLESEYNPTNDPNIYNFAERRCFYGVDKELNVSTAQDVVKLWYYVFSYIDVAGALPDMTQNDFVNDYLKVHNAYLSVSGNSATVRLVNDLIQNKANAIELTEIDYDSVEWKPQRSDVELYNRFAFADSEEGELRPNGTDLVLTADILTTGGTGDKTKDQIKLKTAPTAGTQIGAYYTSDISILVSNSDSFTINDNPIQSVKPRLVLAKTLSGNLTYTETKTPGTFVTATPLIGYFADPSDNFSLGFGNWYRRFFTNEQLLLDGKTMDLEAKLTYFQALRIMERGTVYIQRYNSFFVVAKITANLVDEGLFKMTLYKI